MIKREVLQLIHKPSSIPSQVLRDCSHALATLHITFYSLNLPQKPKLARSRGVAVNFYVTQCVHLIPQSVVFLPQAATRACWTRTSAIGRRGTSVDTCPSCTTWPPAPPTRTCPPSSGQQRHRPTGRGTGNGLGCNAKGVTGQLPCVLHVVSLSLKFMLCCYVWWHSLCIACEYVRWRVSWRCETKPVRLICNCSFLG